MPDLKPTPKRIIQIAACGHENAPTTQSNWILFALDEDGVLWARPNNSGWEHMPGPAEDPEENRKYD